MALYWGDERVHISLDLSVRAVAEVDDSRADASDARPSDPGLDGVRVLVVDDQDDARDLVSTVLADAGAHVVRAVSGAEAIQTLAVTTIDVLVSGISMPTQDGYSLIRRVRSTSSAEQLPALALTAFARTEDRVLAFDAGIQKHHAKPIDAHALIAAVRELANARKDNG